MTVRTILPRVLVGAVLLLLALSVSPLSAFAQGPYGGYGGSGYGSSGSGYGRGSGYGSSGYGGSGYGSSGYGGSGYGSSSPAYSSGSAASFVYVVRRGDTLIGIARRFGVSPFTLASINHIFNLNLIFSGMRLIIPRANQIPPTQVYIVRPGDTLTGIAIRFHTSVMALAIANNIPNPNLIFAGMRLVITGGSPMPYYAPPASSYGAQPSSPYGPYAAPPMNMPGMNTAPAPQPSPSSPPASGTVMVSIQNIAFNPNTITVRVGTTVMWMNNETSAIPHTVTSGTPSAPSGMFDSGTLNPGQSFQFTFTTPGTFAYYCRIHGAAMTGTVTVTP